MGQKLPREVFKRAGAEEWTVERIARLPVQDIKQLRDNAERLNEAGVAARCSEALAIVASQKRTAWQRKK